mmetsp:Transcript_12664/g.32475  ORF Transcript_12664/g.32475 Transcript_12664/m.32475 type:complete len:157 (-) Transcript_12664:175-645(-)|eukprot:jgi/Tetstr1/431824/TSEL_021318.t1
MGLVDYSSSDDGSKSDNEEGGSPYNAAGTSLANAPSSGHPSVQAAPPVSGLPDADALFGGGGLPAAVAAAGHNKRPLYQAARSPAVGAPASKVPRSQNTASARPPAAGRGGAAAGRRPAMLPPQLGARKNVPTEDMKRLFTQQQGRTDPAASAKNA